MRDCRVKVAANYILKAGEAIYEDFVKENEKKRRGKWEVWAKTFRGYTEMYENVGDVAMTSLAGKVYVKMKRIDPGV